MSAAPMFTRPTVRFARGHSHAIPVNILLESSQAFFFSEGEEERVEEVAQRQHSTLGATIGKITTYPPQHITPREIKAGFKNILCTRMLANSCMYLYGVRTAALLSNVLDSQRTDALQCGGVSQSAFSQNLQVQHTTRSNQARCMATC